MRIASRGNLTIELIRLQRFDPGFYAQHQSPRPWPVHPHRVEHVEHPWCRADKVEFGPEPRPSDAWALDVNRVETHRYASPVEQAARPEVDQLAEQKPQPITPVAGSPALAGLGVCLIVPGTLLDVVA